MRTTTSNIDTSATTSENSIKEKFNGKTVNIGIESKINLSGKIYADAEIEKLKEEVAQWQLKTALVKEELESKKQDREDRKKFSNRIYRLTIWYLIVVAVILSLSSIKWDFFQVSDNVTIALLTTTTANVIGLLIIVVTYLFPKRTP